MKMNDSKIRIGIVGCGHWGKNYVRNFFSRSDSQVTAVSDINPKQLASIGKNYPGILLFTDYKEIIKNNLCDALIVSTVASTHYEIAKKAFEGGLHVLAEKPLTLSVEEAEKLVELSLNKNKILFVAHTFLFNKCIRKIKEFIDNGLVGDIYYMKARRTHLGLVRSDVNAVWDLAPHDISMFIYLLNETPTMVQAIGGKFLKKDREDVAFINLVFPCGVVGNITVSWADSNKERYLDIVGSKARILFDDLNNLEPVRIFYKGIAVEYGDINFGEFQYLLRDGEIVSPKIEIEEPLKLLCNSFIDSVQTGQVELSDGVFGKKVVEVLCKIEQELKIQGVKL